MPFLKRPLTFATPSVVNDTLKARTKVKRDLMEILRAAEQYLGPQDLDQVVSDHRKARRGRKPNKALNEFVLAEWGASPTKDPTEFSKAFIKKYPQHRSAGAIEKRLERLLKAQDRDRRLKAALQRPSLLGEAKGTE